jgi:hypothetical protein
MLYQFSQGNGMRLLHHEEKIEERKRPVELQTHAEGIAAPTAPIARLQKATERRRRNYDIANTTGFLTVFAELATAPLVLHIVSVGTADRANRTILEWAGSCLLFAAISLAYTWRGKRELDQAITDVADITTCDAIGPLVDMVVFYDPHHAFITLGSDYRAYQAAVQALTHLLPRLTAEDSSQLSAKQRQNLPRVLQYVANPRSTRRYNIPFALAILKALEEIGDGVAIPSIQRLAKMKPRTEEQRLLREAAEMCLSRLRERDQEVELQNSLLRASSSVPTDTLLRAVTETPTTDPTQLLRAGQEEKL